MALTRNQRRTIARGKALKAVRQANDKANSENYLAIVKARKIVICKDGITSNARAISSCYQAATPSKGTSGARLQLVTLGLGKREQVKASYRDKTI